MPIFLLFCLAQEFCAYYAAKKKFPLLIDISVYFTL